VHHELTIH